MLILLLGSTAALFYIYIGYPLLLRLLVLVRGPRPIAHRDITPPVTLLVSAYNEEAVIGHKLENALALDYPSDLLQIVVVSDASSDRTDEIVRSYASRGVTLVRQPERRGKTAGLNSVVPVAREIVVFSDANAMYQPDAIRKLVRNFADPLVGCVTGEARYTAGDAGAADVGEHAYWNYELQIKRLETAVGSSVGGDGAIYAIRRHLWKALPDTAINDFLNPLQIVEAGWRSVYEPEAVCMEDTAGEMGREYQRRVRIVSRSWRAVFQASGVLNPFRVKFFTVSVVSHKILRWLSAAFLGLAVIGAAGLLWRFETIARLELIAGALMVSLATAIFPAVRRVASLGLYFGVINVASLVGMAKGSLGTVSGTWSTPREAERAVSAGGPFAAGRRGDRVILKVLVPLVALVILSALAAGLVWHVQTVWRPLFWSSAAVLIHVYVGYPLTLAVLKRVARREPHRGPLEPRVCLFITANDEGAVLDAKLRNCLEIDYPRDRLEIVVASDGSVDDTNSITRAFSDRGVRLLDFEERRGKIAAINAGVPLISSDVIVFSDANAFIDRSAIRALVRNFADPQIGAVSGDVIMIGDRAALGISEDLYYRYERWLQRAESDIGSMVGVDGALYAIRHHLFTPPPDDTILDDVAIPMAAVRAGYRVVFDGSALAYEQGSRSAREEFGRKSRIVAGAVQFLNRRDSVVPRRHPQVIFSLVSHKVLRWLSPALVALGFVSSIALAPASSFYLAAALLQAAFLTLGLAGCMTPLRRVRLIGVAHYICLVHAAAAAGFLRGFMGRQPAMWRRFARTPVEAGRV